MDIFGILTFLSGLAMFLYGMTIMGKGLEQSSGGKLETVLEKLTRNKYMGVLLGALVTGVIQSSSATTVMVVGFVNSGIMQLSQAVGVIMGANIGTTVTSALLSLGDLSSSGQLILQFLKPTSLSAIALVLGAVVFMFSKVPKRRDASQILLGFGILFIGMSTMESSVSVISDSPALARAFTMFSNPFLGVLVGAGVTALIQSSSASVGILQALTATGMLPVSAAIPVILGQNIGTCITAIMSSIGANRNAKRAAMVHLYFNIIGTIVFMVVIYIWQGLVGFDFWNDPINRSGIALFHIIFNIGSTALLLPFSKYLEKLAVLTVNARNGKGVMIQDDSILDERFLQSPALALEQCRSIVLRMGQYAHKNFEDAVGILSQYDPKIVQRIVETENVIDEIEAHAGNYLIKITNKGLTAMESKRASELLHTISDFERIGDYSVNIHDTAVWLNEKGIHFSQEAIAEIDAIASAVNDIVDRTIEAYTASDPELASHIEPLEEVIDMMQETLRTRHVNRLKEGTCSVESGVQFLDLLTNFERIADHCSNIAVYVIELADRDTEFDPHLYLRSLHEGKTEKYSADYQYYERKYLARLE